MINYVYLISGFIIKKLIVFIYYFRETNTNFNDIKSVQVLKAAEVKPVKKDFYFYQGNFLKILTEFVLINLLFTALDGQHIYLSAVNVEMLESMFGSLENSPQEIKATVIEKQYLSMTEALRKRYRFLLHLPITTVFEWVEIDLENIVNQETLFIFKSK